MPRINYPNASVYQIYNNEKSTILLKCNPNQALVWEGTTKTEQNINEEPLILKFDDKNNYFYSKNIKEINNEDWIINENIYQLNDNQQKNLIQAFDKLNNQKNLAQKIILLELKNEYLTKENQELKKENENLKQENNFVDKQNEFLVESSNKIINTNDILRNQNEKLYNKSTGLQDLNEIFKWKIKTLTKEQDESKKEIEKLREVNELLTQKVATISKKKQELTEEKPELKKEIEL
ncbi:MAG: hypothetical protein REH79_02180 [Spiroplasma sp.]|nr:hypothetical protein [Spiroplasma sp.]